MFFKLAHHQQLHLLNITDIISVGSRRARYKKENMKSNHRGEDLKISREAKMKTCLFALFALLLAPFAYSQQTSAPEIKFKSVPDFFKLPAGMNFGEVPGVAVDSKGNIYVFSRSNSATGPAYAAAA